MEASFSFSLALVASSALSVLAALLLAALLERRPALPLRIRQDAVFLIGDALVIDTNARGAALLETLARRDTNPAEVEGSDAAEPGAEPVRDPGPAIAWRRLTGYLAAVFPDFPEQAGQNGSGGAGTSRAGAESTTAWALAAADNSGLELQGEQRNGALRLTLREKGAGLADASGPVQVDRLSWRALTEELEVLRRTTDLAPCPAWREDAEGRIVWANGAYMRLLAESLEAAPMVWPLPALFPAGGEGPQHSRHRVNIEAGTRSYWFDIVDLGDPEGRLRYALPADDAQRAERTRRDFVQTLSRTFATLPIGLAVFDRTRRLQLFNPALTDLTQLEPEFLTSMPGLKGFLNRMHEKHILPTPRDGQGWTRRLLDVETAANTGGFEETWPLPDGRIYRISARPHPDGALAFLIEDITSDVHLKRAFRAELDAGRAALDMAGTGLAVFGANGSLLMTNSAFDTLWQFEGLESLAGVHLREALAHWREQGGHSPLWDRVAALAFPGPAEATVSGEMRMADGDSLWVQARRAPGGRILLGFSEPPSAMTGRQERPEPVPSRQANA